MPYLYMNSNGYYDSGFNIADISLFDIPAMGDIDYNNSLELKDAFMALDIFTGNANSDIDIRADINSDEKIGLEEAIFIFRTSN